MDLFHNGFISQALTAICHHTDGHESHSMYFLRAYNGKDMDNVNIV
jgi:hypothetical protein